MKHLLTIAFISTCLFSFGQSNMFWNNYANINPAMSGFQFKQHATASYTNNYPALIGNYLDLHADYGMVLADHHGIGISYTGNFSYAANNSVLLNYNYQFNFEKAGRLSVGTGLGYGRSELRSLISDLSAPLPGPVNSFQLNAGIAYNWKKLLVGASAVNMIPTIQDQLSSYFFTTRTRYVVHASYDIQVSKKFQLMPRAIYSYEGGFQQLGFNLTTTYNDQFSLGVNAKDRNTFGFNLGWRFMDKFNVAYMHNMPFSQLNNAKINGGIHEVSFAYQLRN